MVSDCKSAIVGSTPTGASMQLLGSIATGLQESLALHEAAAICAHPSGGWCAGPQSLASFDPRMRLKPSDREFSSRGFDAQQRVKFFPRAGRNGFSRKNVRNDAPWRLLRLSLRAASAGRSNSVT
jgi:hypothetical protein